MNESPIRPRLGFVWLKYGIALTLLVSSGLKAYQISMAPLPPAVQGSVFTPLLELLNGRYFLMGVVVCELLWVLVLIADLCRPWAWLASLIGFSIFTFVSLVKGLAGEADCGCWGNFTVNPFATMVFDLVVVSLLLVFWERTIWTFPVVDRRKLAAVLIAWLALAGPVLYAMFSLKQRPHAILGTEFTGADGKVTILLEPKMWIGKKFPLWDHVDDSSRSRIEKGDWNIVIARKQCEDCKKLIEKLGSQTIPLAILELNDDSMDMEYSESQAIADVKGDLKMESHWMILTPCLVQCRDGTCVSVGEKFSQD